MREIHEQADNLGNDIDNASNDVSGQFLGRAVWFHCKICERVQIQARTVKSGDRWEEASITLRAHDLDPQDVWWFHTLCGRCQSMIADPSGFNGCHVIGNKMD